MLKLVIKGLVTIVSGLFFGALGLFIGAYLGGNYAQEFSLMGVRGYEAAGQVGFILGAIMGVMVSLIILQNRSNS